MADSPVILRPHHGLCIWNFVGKGYSSDFVKNMDKTIRFFHDFPETPIVLLTKTDILCNYCPHNFDKQCESFEKVLQYDNRVLTLCNLKNGQILSWKEFYNSVYKNILLPQKLLEVCADCKWLSLCQSQHSKTLK